MRGNQTTKSAPGNPCVSGRGVLESPSPSVFSASWNKELMTESKSTGAIWKSAGKGGGQEGLIHSLSTFNDKKTK